VGDGESIDGRSEKSTGRRVRSNLPVEDTTLGEVVDERLAAVNCRSSVLVLDRKASEFFKSAIYVCGEVCKRLGAVLAETKPKVGLSVLES
jgi:hypothetical protein